MTTGRGGGPIEPGREAGPGIFRMVHPIRAFEARVAECFANREIPSFIHLSVGRCGSARSCLVVETDKAEVEAPASGTLLEIIGAEKTVYPVGEVIAVLDTGGAG